MEQERHFPRQFAALEAIFAFVSEFYLGNGLVDEDSSVVELIIEEIFTNMVKYSVEGKKDIAIRLRRQDDAVEIRLTDFDVLPFDYAKARDADLQQLLAQKRSGGLGLHLVRQMADSFTSEYVGGHNQVTILKRLGA